MSINFQKLKLISLHIYYNTNKMGTLLLIYNFPIITVISFPILKSLFIESIFLICLIILHYCLIRSCIYLIEHEVKWPINRHWMIAFNNLDHFRMFLGITPELKVHNEKSFSLLFPYYLCYIIAHFSAVELVN